MELKSDFSKAKPGDWALTLQFGWGKIADINRDKLYAIVVCFRSYTIDGKMDKDDTYPTCFPADQVPECFLEIYGPPPVEFKDGEPVWVSMDGETWLPRVLRRRGADDTFFTYESCDTSAGPWSFCCKWEDKP